MLSGCYRACGFEVNLPIRGSSLLLLILTNEKEDGDDRTEANGCDKNYVRPFLVILLFPGYQVQAGRTLWL